MHRVLSLRLLGTGVVLLTLIVTLVLSSMVFAAGETLTSPSDKALYEGQHITITDLQVNGSGDDEINMNLSASNGSLQFNNSDGLTFDGLSAGSNIKFSGTRSAVNAALLTLRYYTDEPGTHTVEATLGDGNYWVENGHVYLVVADSGISWQDAKTAAEAATYGGVNGYLATITSQGEHDFILERINDSGWIGANDINSEGVWRWETGPEAGDQFWSGADDGSAFGGAFTNWNDGEPNNSGDSEDCGQIWFSEGSEGEWNDLNCASEENEYYVVEFGEEGDLPAVASTDFEVTVTAAPEVGFTSLTPADNSAALPTDSVSITFNQPMSLGEGSLSIYNAADDSEVADLWSADTEDNLTFTFDLPETLEVGNSYYVQISDSFLQGLIAWYGGFQDKTTWNFSIISSNTPNGGDANNDSVIDSEQANVSSQSSSITGKYTAIELDEECTLTEDAVTQEKNFDIQDLAYEYDNGLWEFEADCGTPGFVVTVKLYYYGVSADNMVVRKHNPVADSYFTLDDATIDTTTIDGQSVVVVTYQIKDGSERDVDATENGEIIDPAGLAAQVLGAPNTGVASVRDLLFIVR